MLGVIAVIAGLAVFFALRPKLPSSSPLIKTDTSTDVSIPINRQFLDAVSDAIQKNQFSTISDRDLIKAFGIARGIDPKLAFEIQRVLKVFRNIDIK